MSIYLFFAFAHRAFCANDIRLRPAGVNLLRPVRLAPRFAPLSKASIRCSIFAISVFRCWYRLRSAFSNLVTKSTFSPVGCLNQLRDSRLEYCVNASYFWHQLTAALQCQENFSHTISAMKNRVRTTFAVHPFQKAYLNNRSFLRLLMATDFLDSYRS